MTLKPKTISAALLLASAAFMANAAQATVINFDALPGSNGDAYTSYTESGYTLQHLSGDAHVGKAYGNPIPDVFFYGANAFRLSSTGQFAFNGIDFSANNGSLDYSIKGYVGSTEVWNLSSTLAANPPYSFQHLGGNATLVDYVTFSLTANGTSGNLDNIEVLTSAVPEPSSAAMLMLGMGALAVLRRRKVS